MSFSSQFKKSISVGLVVAFLVSCGGGGGGASASGSGNTSSNDFSNSTTSELLDHQNSKIESYFSTAKEFLDSTESIKNRLNSIDRTDLATAEKEVDEIIKDSDYNYLLAQEFIDLGEDIKEIERSFQEKISASAETNSTKNSINGLESRSVTATFAAVCAVAGAVSLVTTLQQDTEDQQAALKKASDDFKSRMDVHRAQLASGEISQEAYNEALEQELDKYGENFDKATLNYVWSSFYHTGQSFVTNVLPNFITSQTNLAIIVKGDLETASLASDLHSVYLWATRPGSDTKIIGNKEAGEVTSFIVKSDSTQDITLPVGDWEIVAFVPGVARFGTRPGEFITIKEGETTDITVSTFSSETATAGDFDGCYDENTCQLNYLIDKPDNGQVTLSGDPDFPKITWSRNDGKPAYELYIEADYGSNIYHLKGDIPNTVQYGEYGYPGTSAGENCYFGGGYDCTDVIPLTEERYFEYGYVLWIETHDTENFDSYMRAHFQIFGETCE